MILGILQARCSSSRLPGKVLKPILGKPMLLRQIERLARSQRIQKLVVATSTDPSDAPLEEICRQHGIACFRGSLNDVLERFYQAAVSFGARDSDWIVRLTGDCPLIDPQVVDAVIDFGIQGGYDYASNALKPTFPDGLDVEVIPFARLAEARAEATLPSDREHVLPFIHKRPQRFRLGSYEGKIDHSSLRWTVDEPADFELVNRIYEALYPENPEFSTQDILNLISENPRLSHLNKGFERNEGYKKSLSKDRDKE